MGQNEAYQEEKIDLLELIRVVVNGKKIILRFVVVFGLVGLIIALSSAKEYTASTIVVPQTSGGKVGGKLGGLAAIAGLGIGGAGDSESIPPNLYPKIVKSIPFKKELLNTPIRLSNGSKTVTYREYYRSHNKPRGVLGFISEYTIGLPRKILNLFKKKNKQINTDIEQGKSDEIHRITLEEKSLFAMLSNQLVVENNAKDGFVFLSFSMPEALPAAQMAKRSQELLQKAITNFKVQKAQEEFEFISKRYKEIKSQFIKKQSVLASSVDRNQGLVTRRSQTRLKRLESEYDLLFSVYTDIAKKLETQKIKLKEDTPAFIVIEPVSVPLDRSKPRRGLILAISVLLGIVFGVAFVFVKEWLESLKSNS